MAISKKNESIYVRVSTEEKKDLEEKAKLAGLSLSRFLAVSALGAEAPSRELLLRWDMALFQLRRTDVTLREIKKVFRKQKDWSVYGKVVSTLSDLESTLKVLGLVRKGEGSTK